MQGLKLIRRQHDNTIGISKNQIARPNSDFPYREWLADDAGIALDCRSYADASSEDGEPHLDQAGAVTHRTVHDQPLHPTLKGCQSKYVSERAVVERSGLIYDQHIARLNRLLSPEYQARAADAPYFFDPTVTGVAVPEAAAEYTPTTPEALSSLQTVDWSVIAPQRGEIVDRFDRTYS